MDTLEYKTIEAATTGEYKEKGSKFIAYAFPVFNRAAVKEHLDNLKKEHFKSRHVCFAYRVGADGADYRQSDDGEPSGTAGRPILGQIDSYELTNVLVAVVRYFGGTKLGVSGLISSYRIAAKEALAGATIITKTVDIHVAIQFDYEHTGPVMRVLDVYKLQPTEMNYQTDTALKVFIPLAMLSKVIVDIKAAVTLRQPEELYPETEVDGLTFKLGEES